MLHDDALVLLLVFEGKLSVMYSFRLGCKFSCQNFEVHPKFTLDVSTKFHAFHLSPTPLPPPPRNGNFSLGLRFESLKLNFGNWLLPHLPPLEMGLWDFSRSGLKINSWKLVITNPLPQTPKWKIQLST